MQSSTKSITDSEDYNNSHRPMSAGGKDQWIARRRRRKDEEINTSSRSSNSSGGNPGSHHNKISPASPSQPAFTGGNRDSTTSGNSGTSSGHSINTRPMAQQQFDLAESSFPPLPVLDQNVPTTTLAANNQNVVNNVSKSLEGTSDIAIALDATSIKLITANMSLAAAWGESRLADVVKGTAKTKSNKTDKDVYSDTRSNSASPTPASHQNQQQFHSVGSQKSNDNSHTVISVKTLQNLDNSLAQRSGGAGSEQHTDGELSVLHGSTVALTPPFSPEQCVAQIATTNNPNNKIKPPVIIKCTTADKSTKTDELLLNGSETSNASSSPSSAEIASNIQNQLLNSSFENISISGGIAGPNVATMTSIDTSYGGSSSVAKPSIGLVVSTSAMTTSIPKAHTQQYKHNTSKPIHKSSTNNPSQTQVFISQTHPISLSPTSPGSFHLNEHFVSLASPPLTNNAIAEQIAASTSARLSYAQVAQHNKELLSKTAEPHIVQIQHHQSDKFDKYLEKDHKRKDLSPSPRVSSHVSDVRLERAGKT